MEQHYKGRAMRCRQEIRVWRAFLLLLEKVEKEEREVSAGRLGKTCRQRRDDEETMVT